MIIRLVGVFGVPVPFHAPTAPPGLLPLLLHVKECHSVGVLQQEVASPSIENAITWGTLHLLRHFVAKVLDDQLQWCKRNTAVNTRERDGHVKSKLHEQHVWIIIIEILMSSATPAGHLQSVHPTGPEIAFHICLFIGLCDCTHHLCNKYTVAIQFYDFGRLLLSTGVTTYYEYNLAYSVVTSLRY